MKALAAVAFLSFCAVAVGQSPVYKPGDPGVTSPSVVTEKRPSYTPEAMRASVEGTVVLEAVIDTDGKATKIAVKKSLDAVYGLDRKAEEALAGWRFKPGTKDGKPVPVHVTVDMTFTLRDRLPVFDKSTPGVTPPAIRFEKRPVYTAEAMREKVKGSVFLEGIVGTDGRVTGVKVIQSLRPDLDENAVDAFSQWGFRPARLGGRAVPFRVQVEITFTLR
jgi:TonB family protein